jgi:hypothetical protein
VSSLYPKRVNGKTYWCLREMARVNGRPKRVSEPYLGTAAEVEVLLDAHEQAAMPDRSRHLAFGDIAAVWGVLEDLGVAGIIDDVVGPRPGGLPLSPGTYLAMAAANRVVAPCFKAALGKWWQSTAADRFTKIPASALDHRRFWDAMHSVGAEHLERISHAIALRLVEVSGVDISSVALDMTNFATFIASAKDRAPIAQRGKAKQKRSDLRLVGLGLVVTRNGGLALTWHTYPGDRPDVTQFPEMLGVLRRRYEAIVAARGQAVGPSTDMKVVFAAGQNSEDNFAPLAESGLHYVGSVPASDCPELVALPSSVRRIVDSERFGGLTAFDTRREVYGAARRLDELTGTLSRGRARRSRDKVEAEIERICAKPWVRRVVTWELHGSEPRDLRLHWAIDAEARSALEEELFGKHVLITDHDDWPVPEVVAGYRSQSEAESSFRQMKDPQVVSFSPMYHWTDHNIRVHVFTCVLALQVAHLMRHRARQAGLDLSVRALLDELAGIGETVLLYQGEKGRPRARRMLTETSPTQDALVEVFHLPRYAPRH